MKKYLIFCFVLILVVGIYFIKTTEKNVFFDNKNANVSKTLTDTSFQSLLSYSDKAVLPFAPDTSRNSLKFLFGGKSLPLYLSEKYLCETKNMCGRYEYSGGREDLSAVYHLELPNFYLFIYVSSSIRDVRCILLTFSKSTLEVIDRIMLFGYLEGHYCVSSTLEKNLTIKSKGFYILSIEAYDGKYEEIETIESEYKINDSGKIESVNSTGFQEVFGYFEKGKWILTKKTPKEYPKY